jgi:hypothetical protein
MHSEQWEQRVVSAGPPRFHIHQDPRGTPFVINKTANGQDYWIYRFQERGLWHGKGSSKHHPQVDAHVAGDGRLYEVQSGERGKVYWYTGIVVERGNHSVVTAFEQPTNGFAFQPVTGPIHATHLAPSGTPASPTSGQKPWDGVFYDEFGKRHDGGRLLSAGLSGVEPRDWPNGTKVASKHNHVFEKIGTRNGGGGVWHDTSAPTQQAPSQGIAGRVAGWFRSPKNGDTRNGGREVFQNGQWIPNPYYQGAYGAQPAYPVAPQGAYPQGAYLTPGSLSQDGTQMWDGQSWGPTPIGTLTPYGYWNGYSFQPTPIQAALPQYGAPSYGVPSYGPPSYGTPNYGTPNYGAPALPPAQQPQYGAQPAYGTPSYGTPSQPAYPSGDPGSYFLEGAQVALAGVELGQGGAGGGTQAGGDQGYQLNADGTISFSDGRTGYVAADGSLVLSDGTVIAADGTVASSGGDANAILMNGVPIAQ